MMQMESFGGGCSIKLNYNDPTRKVPAPISTFENFLNILKSNTNQMWPLLLKFIGEQDSEKKLHVAMVRPFSTPCLLKF